MSSAIETKKLGLNLFGQNTSLLFQFLLAEFIDSYKEVQGTEKIYKDMEGFLITHRLNGDVSGYLNDLLHCITNMVGSGTMNEQVFFGSRKRGCLSNLRHYSYLIVNSSDAKDKTLVNLDICISTGFHSALQARETIIYLQQETHNPSHIPDYVMLYQLLDKLIENINRVSRLILRTLIEFHDDENVIYFLLRHKEQLDDAYKTNFVAKVFRKMYPNGVEEAGQMLIKKYAERGFTNLLNTIAEKISALDI